MRFPVRFLVPAIAFAGLVGFFLVGLQRDPSAIPSPLIGKPAPAFSLESLGDPAWKVGPADFDGKPWLLNVWGTWCVECRAEHAALLAIAHENRVPIMGLNWLDDRASTPVAGPTRESLRLVAFDPEGSAGIAGVSMARRNIPHRPKWSRDQACQTNDGGIGSASSYPCCPRGHGS
jgi:cytochrome c biogenesis protein CcmG/thiol:disulfide interchange protein DsbE